MVAIQYGIMYGCLALLALGLLVLGVYAIREPLSRIASAVKAHPVAAAVLAIPFTALVIHGSTKQVVPTVKGISLGSPMETPTEVRLSWQADEGTEIKTNQRVRVLWRDGYSGGWKVAAEGYGITNAVISGFFINRDTDWLVEVEGLTNDVEEVTK